MTSKVREAMKGNMRKQAEANVAAVPSNAVDERFERLAKMTGGSVPPTDLPPVKFIDVDAIRNREKDVRALNAPHVIDLALSFVAVGMLHFPIIDQHDVLLAGGHRKEAVALLKAIRGAPLDQIRLQLQEHLDPEDPLSDDELGKIRDCYDKRFARGVVVHVFNTSGLDDESVRRQVEFIENDHRRDFTKEEIKNYISELESAGYKRTEGRPKSGQRLLSVELGRVIGKSRATVFRILKELKEPRGEQAARPSPSSVELARKASAQLEAALGTKVKVQVRESAGTEGAGSIVIQYNSFKQRAALMRELGLKE
jgi:hypothetical protein